MLNLKVPAVIAVALFMSSVSVQAMEFADRPGPIAEAFFNSPSSVHVMPSRDRSRRQINNHLVLQPLTVAIAKLADRPRPISNVIKFRIALGTSEEQPGRLSAEFSAAFVGSFEHRPWVVVGSRVKDIATPAAMRFEDRPGPLSNRFKTVASASIKFADHRAFTSSLPTSKTPFGLHIRPASARFCVGSIAPCDLLRFTAPSRIGVRSAAHYDERLYSR